MARRRERKDGIDIALGPVRFASCPWSRGPARVIPLDMAVAAQSLIGLVPGGVLALLLAFRAGLSLTGRLRDEADPGRQLVLNVLLALAVLLALIGVGLITAPLV